MLPLPNSLSHVTSATLLRLGSDQAQIRHQIRLR